MGRTKYKTKIARNAGEWSDERILATGKAYRNMSDERFWSRYENLQAIGDRVREESTITYPPPYILRALRDKDTKKLAAYMQRRGAEFDFKQWAKQEGLRL